MRAKFINEFFSKEEDKWADEQINNWKKEQEKKEQKRKKEDNTEYTLETFEIKLIKKIRQLEEWLYQYENIENIIKYDKMISEIIEAYEHDMRHWPINILKDLCDYLEDSKQLYDFG